MSLGRVRPLEVVPGAFEHAQSGTTRTFETGATRDTDEGKYDYEGFLSPDVLERFAAYMHKHRLQSDGKLRASDNWQKGIPREQYAKSLLRHVMDFWQATRRGQTERAMDAAMGIMFNIMSWVHETLKLQGSVVSEAAVGKSGS